MVLYQKSLRGKAFVAGDAQYQERSRAHFRARDAQQQQHLRATAFTGGARYQKAFGGEGIGGDARAFGMLRFS